MRIVPVDPVPRKESVTQLATARPRPWCTGSTESSDTTLSPPVSLFGLFALPAAPAARCQLIAGATPHHLLFLSPSSRCFLSGQSQAQHTCYSRRSGTPPQTNPTPTPPRPTLPRALLPRSCATPRPKTRCFDLELPCRPCTSWSPWPAPPRCSPQCSARVTL